MGNWEEEMQALIDNPGNGRSQEEQSGRKKTSIYIVPPFIKMINVTAYQPRVVSFGPYHNGEQELELMEAHKQRALVRCISRSGRDMQEVFNGVFKEAESLKDSYDSLHSNWRDNTESFVKLMILDRCFMLELLHVYQNENYYSDDDPIFSQHGELYVMQFIKTDMLMLENQLPMLLLRILKRILEKNEPDVENLNKNILWLLNYGNSNYPNMGECLHVLDLYRKSLLHTHDLLHPVHGLQSVDEGAPRDRRAPQSRDGDCPKIGNCFHVLNLHLKSLLHTHDLQSPDERAPPAIELQTVDPEIQAAPPAREARPQSLGGDRTKIGKCFHLLNRHRKGPLHRHNEHENAPPQAPDQGEGNWVGHNVVRPAVELHEAGVCFMKSESKSLRAITFHGGVLKLPNFIVDHYTESMFLNLIAFERFHIPAGSDITSFVAFMDRIIDDRYDIKLLSSKGIIDNFVGTDKQAADLFNTMSKDLVMEMNLYKVYTNLINYCNTPRHKWRANLSQTYFRSPWAIISVIATILIFSLTPVQTIFTILN